MKTKITFLSTILIAGCSANTQNSYNELETYQKEKDVYTLNILPNADFLEFQKETSYKVENIENCSLIKSVVVYNNYKHVAYDNISKMKIELVPSFNRKNKKPTKYSEYMCGEKKIRKEYSF